jgi:hypothetical protein
MALRLTRRRLGTVSNPSAGHLSCLGRKCWASLYAFVLRRHLLGYSKKENSAFETARIFIAAIIYDYPDYV